MPTYEMPILFRVLKKPELTTALKRIATGIFDRGGFIRKIENLGVKSLPYKISNHGYVSREASHFIFYFDVPPRSMISLDDEYERDMDVVRLKIYRESEPTPPECTFHEEMLPPPYRPEVQVLLAAAKKEQDRKNKKKFKTGLDYYPFQR